MELARINIYSRIYSIQILIAYRKQYIIFKIMIQGGFEQICQLDKDTNTKLFAKLEKDQLSLRIIQLTPNRKEYSCELCSLAKYEQLNKKCNGELSKFLQMLEIPKNLEFTPPILKVSDHNIPQLVYYAKIQFLDLENLKEVNIRVAQEILKLKSNNSEKTIQQCLNLLRPILNILKYNESEMKEIKNLDESIKAPTNIQQNEDLGENQFQALQMKDILSDADLKDEKLVKESNILINNYQKQKKIYFEQKKLTKNCTYQFKFSGINKHFWLGIADIRNKDTINVYCTYQGQIGFHPNKITQRKRESTGSKGDQVQMNINIKQNEVQWKFKDQIRKGKAPADIDENWVVFISLSPKDKVQVKFK